MCPCPSLHGWASALEGSLLIEAQVALCFLSSHRSYFMLRLVQKLIYAKCKYKGNLLNS